MSRQANRKQDFYVFYVFYVLGQDNREQGGKTVTRWGDVAIPGSRGMHEADIPRRAGVIPINRGA